jgi:hypothetical protein
MQFRIRRSIRAQHRRDRFAPRFRHRDARHALDHARLFHERGVEFRGDAADDGAVVAGEARVGGRGGCGAPEVVGCVGEEVGFGFVEEGGFAAVAFG